MARQLKSLQDVQSYLGAAKETAAAKKQIIYNELAAKKAIAAISRILGERPVFSKGDNRYIVKWWTRLSDKQKEKLNAANLSYRNTSTSLQIFISKKYPVKPGNMEHKSILKEMKALAAKSADVRAYIKMAKQANVLDS